MGAAPPPPLKLRRSRTTPPRITALMIRSPSFSRGATPVVSHILTLTHAQKLARSFGPSVCYRPWCGHDSHANLSSQLAQSLIRWSRGIRRWKYRSAHGSPSSASWSGKWTLSKLTFLSLGPKGGNKRFPFWPMIFGLKPQHETKRKESRSKRFRMVRPNQREAVAILAFPSFQPQEWQEPPAP